MAGTKKEQGYEIYLKQIDALSSVARLIASGAYLDELLRLIVNVTAEVMNSKICSLMVVDRDKRELVIRATQSVSEGYNNKPNIRWGEGIAGRVAKENKPYLVAELSKEPRYMNQDIAEKESLVSLASVPLSVKGKVVGVMNCYTSRKHEFTKPEMAILMTLANQAALAIENAELAKRAHSAEEALKARKLVERAKDILAAEANIQPQEAYRLIQKQSMDCRKTMRDIAEAIILAKDVRSRKDVSS
jgi:signal transduction protein with GAF and PtsI domain